jgi:hypothetical protein
VRQNILILGVLLLVTACETPLHVTTDYDKSVSFQQYKTFMVVVPDKNQMPISELNANRILKAIKAEMIKKGFTENAQNPDLLVHSAAILKQKQSVTAMTDYYGYGGMYRPYGWGSGTGTTTYNVQNYVDGSLIIDVVDAKAKKLIWEGIGNKEIDSPLKDPENNIPIAVAKIMAGFPPGAAAPAK